MSFKDGNRKTLTMKLVSASDRDKVPVLPPTGMDGLKTLILGQYPVRSANATVYVAAALGHSRLNSSTAFFSYGQVGRTQRLSNISTFCFRYYYFLFAGLFIIEHQ